MPNKVLIAGPTASVKAYCFAQWLRAAMDISYDADIRLFDNSNDSGEYVTYMNEIFRFMYGENNKKFLAIKTDTFSDSLIQRMADSHNDCREYAVKNNYKALFHLESDVLCDPSVIADLMAANKPVVGALYDKCDGIGRNLMVQRRMYAEPDKVWSDNVHTNEEPGFIDGTVKEVSHCGLGAVLIRNDVLRRIPFRMDAAHAYHPDSFWAFDLYRNEIPIFVHTGVICNHLNNIHWEESHFKS
jgi:hypothetical protein